MMITKVVGLTTPFVIKVVPPTKKLLAIISVVLFGTTQMQV